MPDRMPDLSMNYLSNQVGEELYAEELLNDMLRHQMFGKRDDDSRDDDDLKFPVDFWDRHGGMWNPAPPEGTSGSSGFKRSDEDAAMRDDLYLRILKRKL